MKYTTLGNTDLKVSPLAVGCMSFGQPGSMHDWTLNYQDSKTAIEHALDLGLNFFDTANVYSKGTSEEYLGRALKDAKVDRSKVVIASKVYFNPGRLSKAAINREIEGTLKRLGTDYLDLYIIHRFDYDTPIEETMTALNDLVKAGKVRAIGASAMYGYQFHNMQVFAQENGLAQFQTMENHYNLLYREDERELIPICKQYHVSLMPYSPLAGGHLAHLGWTVNTKRSQTDRVIRGKYDRMEDADYPIVERVHEISEKHHTTMAAVALAWQWAKGVTAPIIGTSKPHHLDDAVSALDVQLSPDEITYLEELYQPHPIVGAIKSNPPQGTVLLDKK
ncbi:aldo/keto reductase [Lactobacillus corticis]|uniref:Aldo/keto reductase n=1 Tax=Lactobacillus corticis TaxID=2201249 RepID=A0A916QHN6_9LACO|nr:aldo/keto reductase [Lactobacillus corticis]GFZ27514.1 aldo/keto reductase [Lactobacillus corticis]